MNPILRFLRGIGPEKDGAAEARAERQLHALAAIEETDRSYLAVRELLDAQFEEELQVLLRSDLAAGGVRGQSKDGQVSVNVSQVSGVGPAEFQRGRVAGIYALILRLENERSSAREELQRRAKREAK